VLLIFTSCIKEDITNIEGDFAIKPEYAIPIGSPAVFLKEFVTLLNSLNPIDTSNVQDSTEVFYYEDAFYELPSNLQFLQLLEFSFITLEDKIDYFTNLMFRTNVVNAIPARVKMQAYFLDQEYNYLDSLYKQGALILKSANIDLHGKVTSPSEVWKYDVNLSKEEIKNLLGVHYIIIKTELYIEQPEFAFTKYYSEQDLWIQLGAKIKLDLNLNEL